MWAHERLDAVIVGAGQAGLGMAYYLRRDGRSFQVLEQGRIGESWRSQRWDSFTLNTPNTFNSLPGTAYDGPEPDGFWLRDELVSSFERYAASFDLPVVTKAEVQRVSLHADGFAVTYRQNDTTRDVMSRAVVVASGILRSPRVPPWAAEVPTRIAQLHTGDYRNAATLPPGAVVVVGGGQSGCQIAEDLLEAGRTVYLCTSRVARAPRRHRGRDLLEWMKLGGLLDETPEDLEDPAMQFAAQPQISGVGRYGRSVSYQYLAGQGVTLLGRATGVEGELLQLDDSLADNIRFADEKSKKVKDDIDAGIEAKGLPLPPNEDDPRDAPAEAPAEYPAPRTLDLRTAGVGTIIWCTGFTADFSWIDAPVLDEQGRPRHSRGVTEIPGLYFLGFPWLHSRKSGLICGVDEDAEYLAEQITAYLGRDDDA